MRVYVFLKMPRLTHCLPPSHPHTVRGCSKLDDPTNGQVFLTSTTPGALATYVCNPGFRLEGARNRVCQVNGQWSAKEPTCVRKSLQ